MSSEAETEAITEVVQRLRQPLTSISGYAQLARRHLGTDTDRAGRALDMVVDQVLRIDRLLVEIKQRARLGD